MFMLMLTKFLVEYYTLKFIIIFVTPYAEVCYLGVS